MRRKKKQNVRKELEALQKRRMLQIYANDCFTCDAKNLQGKNCHMGHVPWPRTMLSTECKFDVRFVRPQCMVCNVHRGGNAAIATLRMLKENINLDEMWVDNLLGKNKTYGLKWLKLKIAEYTMLL